MWKDGNWVKIVHYHRCQRQMWMCEKDKAHNILWIVQLCTLKSSSVWKGENWVKVVHYHRSRPCCGSDITRELTWSRSISTFLLWWHWHSFMLGLHNVLVSANSILNVMALMSAAVSSHTWLHSLTLDRETVGGIWHYFTRIHFVTRDRVTGRGKGSDTGISVTKGQGISYYWLIKPCHPSHL